MNAPKDHEMVAPADPAALDDARLAERARRGDQVALDVLLDRHLASTWQLASVVHGEPERAAAATAQSVALTLSGPTTPALHLLPARVELLAAARAQAPMDPPGAPPPEPGPRDAAGRARAAFEALPEGWRTVLWLRLVAGLGAREAAGVLGLSVAGTERLLDRARAGWREGAVHQLVEAATTIECRRTTLLLRGYVEAGLSERDRSRVRRHLDGCAPCRAGLEELDDLAPVLRRTAPVPPAGLRTSAAMAWAERTRAQRGPFGMVLPGGRPVPAWAERTLAGATAAVVALGITAAVVGSGRGPRSGREVVVQPAEAQGSPDGESAIGDTISSPELDVPLSDLDLAPASRPDEGSPGPGPSVVEPAAIPTRNGDRASLPREAPRAAPSPTDPPSPPGPTPAPGPGPTPPPADEEEGVTLRIGDTGITVGPDCTGAEVLGMVVGCQPEGESSLPLPGI